MDLAPTILHLFGLPLPADCDGRPLLEYLSFQREPLYAPATIAGITESGYSPEEEAAVEQHLQDLGYL
jgi:arylsulfatase A-like enzyme